MTTTNKIRILIRWNRLRRAQAKTQAEKMDAEGKIEDFQFAQLDNYQSKRIADLESENQHLKNEVEQLKAENESLNQTPARELTVGKCCQK